MSFEKCLLYPFATLTPAGVVFSIVLYPIRLILPLEAVVCLFVITIIVFLCIAIDKQYHNKHIAKNDKLLKFERVEKIKGGNKSQTMRVPNITMEKNKSMPTFISMPLTLNAQIEKEQNDCLNDLITPNNLKSINIKKQENLQPSKIDTSIYSGTINVVDLDNSKDSGVVMPLKPQKIFHIDTNESAIIAKPQTILQEKNPNEFTPSVYTESKESTLNFGIMDTMDESDNINANSELELDKSNNGNGIIDLNKLLQNEKSVDFPKSSAGITSSMDLNNHIEKQKPKINIKYTCPPLELLTTKSTIPNFADNTFEEKAHIIEEKLEEFKISAKCIGVTRGPAITRYEFEMPKGVTVNKVLQYANDISMVLESRKAIRIEAPIPGKNAFGIEVPNDKVDTIGLRDLIDSREFKEEKSPLVFALGKDITNKSVIGDVGKLVHTLVAGSTGSGKSVCMNAIILSLLYKASPADVRIILIDPKFVEFAIYENMPHLLIPKIITDSAQAVNALNWACEEMEKRNRIFGKNFVRSIDEYNEMPDVLNGTKEKMYKIVIMVDELNDLMMNARKDVEEKILKLAQKARSCGIHLILATQRPSVDVITGTIKANLPSRIAFSLTNYSDSKTIIDQGGAEKLLGRGDMLYSPRGEEPIRLLGPFVSQQEVSNVVKFIKEHNECDFDPEIANSIMVKKSNESGGVGPMDATNDEYFVQALRCAIETQVCSTSSLQRRFGIGYQRAARLVDSFEAHGYISKAEGSKPRQIYITMEEFIRQYGNN